MDCLRAAESGVDRVWTACGLLSQMWTRCGLPETHSSCNQTTVHCLPPPPAGLARDKLSQQGYTFICLDGSFRTYCALLGLRGNGTGAAGGSPATVPPKAAAGGWRAAAAACTAIAEAVARAQVCIAAWGKLTLVWGV